MQYNYKKETAKLKNTLFLTEQVDSTGEQISVS